MTKTEARRITHQEDTLRALGFTYAEAVSLRRISMTLHRWAELECGDSNDHASWAIERDEDTDVPYMVRHVHTGGRSIRTRIADREKGALARLAAIVGARNARITDLESADVERNIHASCAARMTGVVSFYVQGDPRGCALYIIRPDDVPEGATVDSCYSRGIAVY